MNAPFDSVNLPVGPKSEERIGKDDGMTIPARIYELRDRLDSLAKNDGSPEAQLIGMLKRCSEMVIDVEEREDKLPATTPEIAQKQQQMMIQAKHTVDQAAGMVGEEYEPVKILREMLAIFSSAKSCGKKGKGCLPLVLCWLALGGALVACLVCCVCGV